MKKYKEYVDEETSNYVTEKLETMVIRKKYIDLCTCGALWLEQEPKAMRETTPGGGSSPFEEEGEAVDRATRRKKRRDGESEDRRIPLDFISM